MNFSFLECLFDGLHYFAQKYKSVYSIINLVPFLSFSYFRHFVTLLQLLKSQLSLASLVFVWHYCSISMVQYTVHMYCTYCTHKYMGDHKEVRRVNIGEQYLKILKRTKLILKILKGYHPILKVTCGWAQYQYIPFGFFHQFEQNMTVHMLFLSSLDVKC